MQTLQSNNNKTIRDSARDCCPQATPDALATSTNARRKHHEQWDNVLDTLIDWGSNPEFFDEDDLDPPTRAAIQEAYQVGVKMRALGWPLPTGLIPDGEGGVVFENRNDPSYQRLEIEADGHSMYLVTFEDCKFQTRDLVEIR